MTTASESFRSARDFLLAHRTDYATAYDGFSWPRPEHFNWALDWFDVIAAGNDRTALRIVEEDGTEAALSFAEMSERSNRVANWLRVQGVGPEDRILVMLGNQTELWETALAAMKLRAVVIPATPLLGPADLRDRVARGRVRQVIVRSEDVDKFDEVPGDYTRITVGGAVEGWRTYEDAYAASAEFTAEAPTLADDPLMLYFTSGTTAHPKLVEHTHTSYPIGHLATMYWIGLPRPAGPSTPGPTCSRPGTRRRPSSSTTTRASTRPG
jgi:acetyl-CoA synthetase